MKCKNCGAPASRKPKCEWCEAPPMNEDSVITFGGVGSYWDRKPPTGLSAWYSGYDLLPWPRY